ncbi:MAG: ABC transporter ATP-binding protein [Defluviitaleaceae bacterium]|nr:ABC transporter ATP-binding protein [Defluviitaleaceae bacterium]
MIEVRNLTKRYGVRKAIDDLSFTIDAGEIVGFLGPNGAGKTTTMNIMTGYIAASSGEVSINGIDILAEPEMAKANIGYLPDTPPVYGDMRVREYLNFVADIKRVRKERKKMLTHVMEQVSILDMESRLIKNLSRGYRQRVGLAQAMIGEPKVIVMDEPTIGLDPKQIIEMRDVVKRLGERHTVILSSHIMQEVSAVCDRVMIINKGKIVAHGTPEGLSEGLQKGQMQVRLKCNREDAAAAFGDVPMIDSLGFGESREEGTVELILNGEDGADIREVIFHACVRHGLPILMMKSNEMSLEEVFLSLTGTEVENVSDI